MSTIVIKGVTYNLPQQGQTSPWGEELLSIIRGLSDALNTVGNPNDIPSTVVSLLNNQTSPRNISGLVLDSATTKGAILSYSAQRFTPTANLSECGQVYITKTPSGFQLARYNVGDVSLVLSIQATGQVQYTTSNLLGAYTGSLNFNVKVFN
jgi:hypothetical protein